MEPKSAVALVRSLVVFILPVLALPSHATVQMYYLHNDHLGTPRVMTNQNQVVVWKGQLKPFGEMKVEVEAITNHRRFPGQWFDIESRLYYNYFRDYDPTIGRYIQSDPVGLTGGINTYAYANGNPISRIDPLGLRDYTEKETREIIDSTRGQSLPEMLINHGGLGKYDFAYNGQANDTFVCNGDTLTAGEFGNYLAGYSGAFNFGFPGYTATTTMGIVFDTVQDIIWGRTPNWDAESFPYIRDGAARGEWERRGGSP